MNERKLGRRALWLVIMVLAAGTLHAEDRWTVTAELVPWDNYSTVKRLGIMPVKMVPQMALWIEIGNGTILDTIYSTRRNSENEWRGADDRPAALPVYNGRRGTLDALSGATPNGKAPISLKGEMTIPPGRYVFYGEVNKSFDYNESYPEETAGVNGQPSLVYRADVNFSGDKDVYRVVMTPVGTGSVDGSNLYIIPGTEGLTMGLSILESMELVLEKR